MDNSTPVDLHPWGGSEPPSQGDKPSDATLMKDLPSPCKAELSALRNLLPNHPEILDIVSPGLAAILAQAVPECAAPLISVIQARIEADHYTALNLYHADLCVQSTIHFHLDIARLSAAGQPDVLDALTHGPLPPDHPFRKYRLSLAFGLAKWFGNVPGVLPADDLLADHPAMPYFLRRLRRFADRLCATPVLDEDATLDARANVLRDMYKVQELSGRLLQWCNTLRGLAQPAREVAVAMAGLDACMEEVRVLAAELVADVDNGTGMSQDGVKPHKRRRAIPSAAPDPEEVNIVEESAGRGATIAAGKCPRRQLTLRGPDTSRVGRQDAQRGLTTRSPYAKRRSTL